MQQLNQILTQFRTESGKVSISVLGVGNINRSFIVKIRGDSGQKRYVLQGINQFVFKDPVGVMTNLEKIYHQCEGKMEGIDLPVLIPTRAGRSYFVDQNKDVWRLFEFVEDSQPLSRENLLEHSRIAGKAYGQFLAILSSLKPSNIVDTIPDFHNTPKRFEDFKMECSRDSANRGSSLQSEIDFLMAREDLLEPWADLVGNQRIPVRVTHNDPKMDNVLIHPSTGVCTMIDLDTVMPGYLMFDFGDMVRSFCTTAKEEDDLGSIEMRLDVFRAVSQGFIESMGAVLTPEETHSLVYGCIVIVYEQSLRFLADYLAGDIYYRIDYPEHNLNRYLNQRRLLESILQHEEELRDIVAKVDHTPSRPG